MNTVPQGTGRRPISASGIILTGRNNTRSAPMTDMQRETAEAPWERGERWWVSLLLWVAIGGVGYVALAVLW